MFTQLNGLDIKKQGAPKTTAKQKRMYSCSLRAFYVNQHADLTDNPAVPALQCRGGTSDRTVGAVPVASLAGHGRGEGWAGAACRWGGSAAGQGGTRADPLVLALGWTQINTVLKIFLAPTAPLAHMGINGKSTAFELLKCDSYEGKCHSNTAVFKSSAPCWSS